MRVKVCGRVFTHLTLQRTILIVLLRGIPDYGTCDVPKHVGATLNSDVYTYRVIRNDWQGFNNLSYTIHLR